MNRKGYLLLVVLLLLLYSCGGNNEHRVEGLADFQENVELADEGMVYVCTGKYSRAYHYDRHCKGLEKCKKQVIVISEQEAEANGRHLCRYCKVR